jgi:hypothetical protein
MERQSFVSISWLRFYRLGGWLAGSASILVLLRLESRASGPPRITKRFRNP